MYLFKTIHPNEILDASGNALARKGWTDYAPKVMFIITWLGSPLNQSELKSQKFNDLCALHAPKTGTGHRPTQMNMLKSGIYGVTECSGYLNRSKPSTKAKTRITDMLAANRANLFPHWTANAPSATRSITSTSPCPQFNYSLLIWPSSIIRLDAYPSVWLRWVNIFPSLR